MGDGSGGVAYSSCSGVSRQRAGKAPLQAFSLPGNHPFPRRPLRLLLPYDCEELQPGWFLRINNWAAS